MAVGAVCFIQIGAASALTLIGAVGVVTALALRNGIAGLVLVAVTRPPVHRMSAAAWGWALLFGAVMTLHGLSVYASISLLPLGVAVAVALLGPLLLAVVRLGWRRGMPSAVAAAVGVVLLVEPFSGGSVPLAGLLSGFACAACWAAYLVLAARVGALLPSASGLALALCATVIPLGLVCAGTHAWEGVRLADVRLAASIAVLGTAIPLAMETLALKRIPVGVMGLLMSLEPAAAALAGGVLAGQALRASAVAGVALVVLASAIASVGSPPSPPPELSEPALVAPPTAPR